METLHVEGVPLALPADWTATPDGTRYLGPEGLLDVRINVTGTKLDHDRVELARAKLADRHPQIELLDAQGKTCVHLTYYQDDALVDSYSFGIEDGKEVVAVYVFLPGSDDIAHLVRRLNLGG